MSDTPKKKESMRSIVIMAVLCGAFLWWWFTIDATPEDVGPAGLVDRAFAELEQKKIPAPLLMEFDLLELSMSWLRIGDLDSARKVAEKISEPALQAGALQAISGGYLGKDAGSMGPALTVLDKISDASLRTAAQEAVLLDIARSGFPDVAWEQASTTLMKAKLIRVMAETDAQNLAKTKLKSTEAQMLADGEIPVLEELAWARLWLRQPDRVLEILPKLSPAAHDEIEAELFRVTRMESPAKADEMLSTLPEHLRLPARLEAAKFDDAGGKADQLVAELQAATKTEDAQSEFNLAKVQWQLSKPEADSWKANAAGAETLAMKLQPPPVKISLLLQLAQLQNDGLDLEAGHRLLEAARNEAKLLTTPEARLAALAPVLEMSLKSAEENEVRDLLNELDEDLVQAGAVAGSSIPTLQTISAALLREGAWNQMAAVLEKTSSGTKRELLLPLGRLLVQSASGPAFSGCQDKSLQKYRQAAASQGETVAVKLAMKLPASAERARAWLEIAKSLVWKHAQETQPPADSPSK